MCKPYVIFNSESEYLFPVEETSIATINLHKPTSLAEHDNISAFLIKKQSFD
jgi:archaellum component FlaF (FlaF/FlaG flagellin family)